ncbi:DUF4906 domain-containing protein [Bacteroides caecigallinarum]|uniref:DUF4906 domain-containing protein n=1 Tax=Bacteroides caecigallinarum TaxID=1411144 RepID=UPI001F38E331|nr:DUF4906 domain-containing protein [Bacteroides caecigallinarum]MCF2593342.1 DUF4906 domain-containing protein [Bacteroides caecigallinarum]
MRLKDIFVYWALIIMGTSLFTSCNYEGIDDVAGVTDGDMVYLGISLPDAENIEVTRAAATDIEKVIYTVRVLVFDAGGNCFYNQQIYDGYSQKESYKTSQALGIPKQTGDNYKNCTVWVVANVGKQTGVSGGSFDFSKVANIDDMNEMYGYLVLQEKKLRDCLPMTGSATVDMTVPTSVGSPVAITMERILAKVSFTINTSSDLEFYFNNWSVESLPRYTYVISQGDDLTVKPSGGSFELYYPGNTTEKDLVTKQVGHWLDELPAEKKSFGFYMYENRRGGRLETPNINNLYGDSDSYPAGIKTMTDGSGASGINPNFKTLYAPDNASFLIIIGVIRNKTTLNLTSFTYKIALGANNYNDYNIERNHNYVYNININGVTHDDVTVDVNAFDSRVHKDYALQITARASEKMDAHYDKRYIEITASTGELKLQFYNTMEDAQIDRTPITTKDWIALSELNTYNIDIDKNESTSKKFNMSSDLEHLRLYIYARENNTTSPRSVVLKITHTPPSDDSGIEQESVHRYYTYTQAGLIEVNGLYVESYEEYGMDLDPSSDELPSAQGLQWGWHGTEIGAYSTSDGLNNTKTIVTMSGNPGSFTNGSLYNDYAARYCYYKNKRDASGNVIEEEAKWYLPPIDELKPLTNSEISASWEPVSMIGRPYWSSSVPTKESLTSSKPWWAYIPAIGSWLWDRYTREYIGEGKTYEYRNVSKSAINGDIEETLVRIYDGGWWSDPVDASFFTVRDAKKYVRAVRKK